MSLIARMEDDLAAAMKERDGDRRDALRLLLNALRTAEKELQRPLSDDEELQVLQRERKRRQEAFEAYEAAGRDEQADKEDYELEVLEEFMPEPLSEDDVERIVDDAIAEVGATSMRDLGRVMADVMPQVAGRADGSVVSQIVREKLAQLVAQAVLSVSNDVAAELAGVSDGVLDSLRERLGCSIHLRGNRLTLEGDEPHVREAQTVVSELVELVEGGHEIGPGTVDAVLGALEQSEDIREVFDDVVWRHRGKKIAPKTVNQKRYVDAIRDHTITFAIGPAGTGKTYLAMALAVRALSEREVGRIILTRPAVEAGERLGFLPGDILAKVDPYLRPLYDALYDMLDADRLTAHMDKGSIEVAPLAFMRGRTLNDSFIILDEAQNTSPEQMQMFLTRLGFGSKVVVTGDATQIDLPREQGSGLLTVEGILGTIDGIAFIRFGHEDVVRHKIVQRIVEAYRLHAEESDSAGHGRDRDR